MGSRDLGGVHLWSRAGTCSTLSQAAHVSGLQIAVFSGARGQPLLLLLQAQRLQPRIPHPTLPLLIGFHCDCGHAGRGDLCRLSAPRFTGSLKEVDRQMAGFTWNWILPQDWTPPQAVWPPRVFVLPLLRQGDSSNQVPGISAPDIGT